MSTATQHTGNSGPAAAVHQAPTPLEQAIAATPTRQQSIRATAAQFLGVPPDKVCALLRNVWHTSKGEPELTDSEMFAGLSLIARYGLDPIAKEVYVTRSSKGLMTILGIDGFVKILHRTEGYDGFEQELGWSANGAELEWVETRIFSKTRTRPTVYRAFAAEYTRLAGFVAKSIPWHMLRLFSLRHCTRLYTPIGGNVVTAEEARWMEAYDPADVPEPKRSKLDDLLPPEPTPKPDEIDNRRQEGQEAYARNQRAEPEPSTKQQAADLFGGENQDAEPPTPATAPIMPEQGPLVASVRRDFDAAKTLDEHRAAHQRMDDLANSGGMTPDTLDTCVRISNCRREEIVAAGGKAARGK